MQASHPPTGVPGIWKKKTIWKARWVKEWKTAKVVKPVWKKVWSPVEIREWVPIPKPPPNWNDSSTLLHPVEEEIPPWHPMPYPSTEGLEITCEGSDNCEGPGPGYEYNKPEPEIPAAESTTSPDTVEPPNQLPQYPPHPSSQITSDVPEPPDYLTPPKPPTNDNILIQKSKPVTEGNSTGLANNQTEYRTISKAEYERPYQREVSPYAVKLAQAVIQEKLNKLKNANEKTTTGLTEVIYRPKNVTTSTEVTPTPNSSTQKTLKLFSSTTESSVKVFVVTPTSSS